MWQSPHCLPPFTLELPLPGHIPPPRALMPTHPLQTVPAVAEGSQAYSLKQCAAESSQWAVRMAAPQKCSLLSLRLTCHGNSPSSASDPPTIRVADRMAGRVPQSAKEH